MKNIKILSIFLVIVIVFAGCKKDDHTGYSTLVPVSGVTLTITPDFTSPVTLVEADSTFTYTITLNKAQVVDLKLYIKVDATTATAGDDFDYLSSVVIPAGSTTAEGWIKIFSDTQFEEGEAFSIQVGDATFSNADFTPVTYEFNINNLTGGDLLLDLSWDPEVYDQNGEAIDATDVADMIFNIFDSTGALIDQADGGSFEELVMLSSLADGVYTIEAEYYSAMTFDDPVDLNIAVSTFQLGISATKTYNYPGLTSTADAPLCNLQVFLLTIEKNGTTYNVVSAPDKSIPFVMTDFVGNYSGIEYILYSGDMYGGVPTLVTSLNATSDTLLVDSLGRQVMMNFWGENVLSQTPTRIVINGDGTLDIPRQFCMTTEYDGANYDYDISGSGNWNSCDMSMDIQFDLIYSDDSGALSNYADDGVLHAEIYKSKKSYHTTIPLKTTSFKHHK